MSDRRPWTERAPIGRNRRTSHDSKARVEILEPRTLLATFLVTNTDDSRAGSLRQAIMDANSAGGVATIDFAIASNGPTVETIAPFTPLPALTVPTFIDGYSQPGSSMNSLATGDNATILIQINGASIDGSADGLTSARGSATIRGLAIDGFTADPSSGQGGNAIVLSSGGDLIAGNFLGTDANGTTTVPDDASGVKAMGLNETIGGTTPASRNLISGNSGDGIFLGVGSGQDLIQGNMIGLDATGTMALGNANGVTFSDAGNNTLGGTIAAAGNVISGNAGVGIHLMGAATSNNLVEGNFIGTDATGTLAIPNQTNGIEIEDAAMNTIGGMVAADGNTIAFNSLAGVAVIGNGAIGNPILGNAIFSNGKLGIDLGGTGTPSTNTPGGPHAGPNDLQNYPVLTSVVSSGASATISGTLDSTPGHSFRIEFFANPSADVSGYGQGQQSLGSTLVTIGPNGGTSPFKAVLQFSSLVGPVISATATDLGTGDTSEFSSDATFIDQQTPPFIVTRADDGTTFIPGQLTLRQAITLVNAGDYAGVPQILFAIGKGKQVIQPKSLLPVLTRRVDIDGSAPLAYPSQSIVLDGAYDPGDNGLTFMADGNTLNALTISGFHLELNTSTGGGVGVVLDGNDNLITGSFIGGDVTATFPPNGQPGQGNEGGGLLIRSSGNTIGSTVGGAPQVIAGDLNYCVEISGDNLEGNILVGNDLGLAGSIDGFGVFVTNTSSTPGDAVEAVIGEAARAGGPGFASGGNDLFGDEQAAIYVKNAVVQIQANLIEQNFQSGIYFSEGGDIASTVGGTNSGDGNIITSNGFEVNTTLNSPIYGDTGITVLGDTGEVVIRGNSIYDNTGLGIERNTYFAPSPNRPPTSLSDPARFPNYPVVASAVAGPSGLTVAGTFDGTEDVLTTVDVFSNAAPDPSGYGEGQTYLGSFSFMTNSAGHADFSTTLPVTVQPGQYITTTATSFATSEFSKAVLTTSAPLRA